MSIPQLVRAAILAAFFVAPAVLAQSFSYQGRLTSGGSSLSSPHDFEFRVFDAQVGGAQVGTTTTRSNVPLTDGTFTTTIDAGQGVFTGAARWVEVAVRASGSTAFTVLTPRQRVDAAPYAIRSLSERWSDNGAGVLANDASVQRVFINRTTPITGAEYFGVTTPTGDSQFGGMYINTAATTGLPFYGYATSGTLRAYHYLDSQRNWVLYNNDARLIVGSNGEVSVGTSLVPGTRLAVGGSVAATGSISATGNIASAANVTGADLRYSAARTRSMAIAASAMQPSDAIAREYVQVTGEAASSFVPIRHNLVASVNLPHGATIVRLKAMVTDQAPEDFIIALVHYNLTTGISTNVAYMTTTGNDPARREFQVIANAFPPVDTTNSTWSLYVQLPPANFPLENARFHGAILEYTVPAPD